MRGAVPVLRAGTPWYLQRLDKGSNTSNQPLRPELVINMFLLSVPIVRGIFRSDIIRKYY